MRVIEINAVPYGSTGKIAKMIAKEVMINGDNAVFVRGWSKQKKTLDNEWIATSFVSKAIHLVMTKLSGFDGCFSFLDTLLLIRRIKVFSPDIVHIHILHSSFINNKLLFRYLNRNKITVVWTFHDCWSFTGGCPYFTAAKCEQWKYGCKMCQHGYSRYAEKMWAYKKRCFAIDNMTIVTPSQWMADLIKESFFRTYHIKVIHNGIDLDIFRPRESNFRERYHCQDKHILLGVSLGWSDRKGLDVFIKLADTLPDDYRIVIVGTNSEIDELLPKKIISINRTESQIELAEIYSAADVFVNPTREDNFPTVNIEALACGTPVITFNTGGSPETITEKCGYVVNCDDIDSLRERIQHVCKDKVFTEINCINRAKCFSASSRFQEYIDLFHQLRGKK